MKKYKRENFFSLNQDNCSREINKTELYGDNIENNEYQKWENSIEGILYDLQMIGDATVEDDRNKILIAKILIALPEEIRNKVLSEVLFVLLEVYGIAGCLSIPVPKGCKNIEQPFILLNFSLIEKQSENCKKDFIAHEIAHFILGHHKSMTYDPLAERKADDLVEKWGFNRVYNDYEQFERLAKINQKKQK